MFMKYLYGQWLYNSIYEFDFSPLKQNEKQWFFMRYLESAIWRLFFHPAKFDNFIDEKMSDYKTVSVAQSKKTGWTENLLGHSMARANLNKSVWLVTNTTAASKYMPRRPRISIS